MSHYSVLVNVPSLALMESVSAEAISQVQLERKVLAFVTANLKSDNILGFEQFPYSTNEFEAAVTARTDALMDSFCVTSANAENIEFYSVEDDERTNYDSGTNTCVLLPNGTICQSYDHRFYTKYTVIDGKVYQRNYGHLKHNKRTKKAKRISVLSDYPIKRLYKTFPEYLESRGYDYDEDMEKYGYNHNPNSRCDWYQIGGRWPYRFLVKETVESVVTGELSWAVEKNQPSTPEGYKWVAGAKKGDIEWELMKSLYIESETTIYRMMEDWFATGIVPEGYADISIQENEIVSYHEVLYIKGESLNDYLTRKGLPPEENMAPYTYAFVQNGEWFSQDESVYWDTDKDFDSAAAWRKKVKEYFDAIPENDILISVDCHM